MYLENAVGFREMIVDLAVVNDGVDRKKEFRTDLKTQCEGMVKHERTMPRHDDEGYDSAVT